MKRRYIREEWPKVQKVVIRGQTRFKVDGRPHKERLFFREKNDAEAQADVWARERQNQGVEALEFPTALRIEATDLANQLKPFGKTLTDAVKHYVTFLQSEEQRNSAPIVHRCIEEWLAVKRAEAAQKVIAARTISELEVRGKLFSTAFGPRRISEIDEDLVKTFLDSLLVTQRTRQNIRTKLVQFLNFCRLKKWITENPASAVRVKVPSTEVSILAPEEAKALLDATCEHRNGQSLVAFVAVSLFAGLRPGEAEQLQWERIHLETGQIEVRAETSKTRETRFVKIEPTLKVWLSAEVRKRGSIVGENFQKQWRAIRKAAGYAFGDEAGPRWPQDVMRHSFASYWLATHADRPRLAEEMGNTVEVIKDHYKRAIPRQIAEAYWNLMPPL